MTIRMKQVAHVCIFARDVEETRRFYEDTLGMKTVFNFTREGRIFGFYLDAGNRTFIEVFENTSATYDGKNQINHICLEVEDLQEAVAHIRAAGTEPTEARKACDETWQAWIDDPNGVKIELFQYTDASAQFAGGDREADW
ncbi:VOC family protein [Pelagovum pacificum]|uniref:VOC family protein n=1 Tax=Pelagovum pacificum TaxID=2588711 RepID=A0A5C5GGL5_9RHOB|nr:VOC family protein [Pelagovum pacificum]QQA43510.1 VOC family protein [Pelagovum pacificum]TNY33354.1 VOC family protein [Pelagovum pacificum]